MSLKVPFSLDRRRQVEPATALLLLSHEARELLRLYVPPNARARHVTLFLDGEEIASLTVPGPGKYTIESAAPHRGSTVEIRVDRTFRAPGDIRASRRRMASGAGAPEACRP